MKLPEFYWVIVRPDGEVKHKSANILKSACINDFFGFTSEEEWQSLEQLGWSCQQIFPKIKQSNFEQIDTFSENEVWDLVWDAVCFSKTGGLINEDNSVIVRQKIRTRFEAMLTKTRSEKIKSGS